MSGSCKKIFSSILFTCFVTKMVTSNCFSCCSLVQGPFVHVALVQNKNQYFCDSNPRRAELRYVS